MFKTSKPGLFLGLAALWKRDEPGTTLLGFAFSGLGGGSMADGQHIPAMNPMGEGVCMHVGNPCSFSVSYFSGQPFPLPVRTWHSLERKSRYGGACLRNTDHTRLYVKPGICRNKSDGKKANPLQLFSLGREIKRQSHPALLGR